MVQDNWANEKNSKYVTVKKWKTCQVVDSAFFAVVPPALSTEDAFQDVPFMGA